MKKQITLVLFILTCLSSLTLLNMSAFAATSNSTPVLTGTYNGTYTYGYGSGSNFTFSPHQYQNGKIKGTILDNNNVGEASLDGQVKGNLITFTKKYSNIKTDVVKYTGTYSSSTKKITGIWTIGTEFGGNFEIDLSKKLEAKINGTFAGTYNQYSSDHPFNIIINQEKSKITGSVIENCGVGNTLGNAYIIGTFVANKVNFKKTYVDASGNFTTVDYKGIYNRFTNKITGTWKTRNDSGSFVINLK